MKILVVEDDQVLGNGIQAGLKQKGYAVDLVRDGETAYLALTTEKYGAVVLDLGLPKLSGVEILKKIRAQKNDLPIIIVTARDAISDRVAGLDAGADDYLVKPFSLEELAARLRAVIRRQDGRSQTTIKYGNIHMDPAAHAITLDSEPVSLSGKEFSILQALMENQGRILSKEKLEERLYGWGEEIESNAVEVHVHHLRKKLGPDLIRTVRGVGYVIEKDRS